MTQCRYVISGNMYPFKLFLADEGTYSMSNEYKYDRVLLKLSGEALAGDQGYGIDPKVVDDQIGRAHV